MALEPGTVLLHVVPLEKVLEEAGLIRHPEVVSEDGAEVAHPHDVKLVEGHHRADVVPPGLVLPRVEVRLVGRLLAAPVLPNAGAHRRSPDLQHRRNLLREGDVILPPPVHLRLPVEFPEDIYSCIRPNI